MASFLRHRNYGLGSAVAWEEASSAPHLRKQQNTCVLAGKNNTTTGAESSLLSTNEGCAGTMCPQNIFCTITACISGTAPRELVVGGSPGGIEVAWKHVAAPALSTLVQIRPLCLSEMWNKCRPSNRQISRCREHPQSHKSFRDYVAPRQKVQHDHT